MTLRYLRVDEEIEHCHYHFELPKHAYFYFLFWLVWILITFYAANTNYYSDLEVPWDNCEYNKTWEPPPRKFINQKQYESELDKVIRFREINEKFRNHNFTRIGYGLTELIYCKEDEPLICDYEKRKAMVNVETKGMMKSIVRTNELDPYVSGCLRFVILQTMVFRMALAVSRTTDVLTSRNALPFAIQLLLSIGPYVQCLQSVSAFWITSLHITFDKLIGVWHPYAFVSFGIFSFLQMFVDLLHDAVDVRIQLLKSFKFHLKLFLFVAFTFSYPYVVLNWIKFFKLKRCHAYVYWHQAILEYTCALAIVVFQFCSALLPAKMYLTSTQNELEDVTNYSKDIYCAAYVADISIYDDIEERTKSPTENTEKSFSYVEK